MHASASLVPAVWASEDNIPGPPQGTQLQPLGFRDAVRAHYAWAHAADHVRSTIFDEAHGPLWPVTRV